MRAGRPVGIFNFLLSNATKRILRAGRPVGNNVARVAGGRKAPGAQRYLRSSSPMRSSHACRAHCCGTEASNQITLSKIFTSHKAPQTCFNVKLMLP